MIPYETDDSDDSNWEETFDGNVLLVEIISYCKIILCVYLDWAVKAKYKLNQILVFFFCLTVCEPTHDNFCLKP